MKIVFDQPFPCGKCKDPGPCIACSDGPLIVLLCRECAAPLLQQYQDATLPR